MSLWRVFTVVTLLQFCHIWQVDGDAGVTCKPLQNCTLLCPHDFEKDSNNCPICSCNDPCKGYDCGLYEVCEVRVLFCADQDPCPPRATCVPKPATGQSTTLPRSSTLGLPSGSTDVCLLPPIPGLCDLRSTRWFFNVTALECQSFQYGGCGGNDNNFLTEEVCLARCLPTSRSCPPVPCAGPCQLQWDNKGCQMCVCPGATCKDVLCASTEECRIVDGQCSTTDQVCYPRPQCQPKSDSTVMMSTPRCPYIDCELMRCDDYGFKKDQFGCKMCSCYDPCEGFECSTGQRCAITPNDCPPGSECRDPGSRYCTEETPPPITRDRPSAEQLMGCCVAGGMTDRCLSLCTPNLTVSTSNIPTFLQCADDLKTYLKCAGGGESYTTCCSRKSVGASCSDFCSVNTSIDTTNLHAFTDCIMNDLNDVINCYLEGISDVKTTVSLMTSGMTSTLGVSTERSGGLEVCTQAMDMGPCEAAIPRWYFNTNTLLCEEFTYGGCEGNDNNFHTQEACAAACMLQVQPSGCPEPICDLGCSLAPGPKGGCNICVCSTSEGMSSTSRMTSKLSTTLPTSKSTTTEPMSLEDCCSLAGVSAMCMPYCSFDFNFDVSHVDRLIACKPYLNVGLRCAKGEKTYRKCCSASGVTGECLESCGNTVNITDLTCLIAQHSDMLNCFSNQQSDDSCARITCSNISCSYGYAKDLNGCPTCECADPCKDMECGVGEVCTYKRNYVCKGDLCTLEYDGECTVECEALDCAACEFGNVKDENGCNTCECFNPCKNVTCSDSEVCVPIAVPTLDGQDVIEIFKGECRIAGLECSTVDCGLLYCQHGKMKDKNGCEICQCFEPCQNVTCLEGMECKAESVVATQTYPYSFIGKCVPHRGCDHIATCFIYCLHGLEKDENKCDKCSCYEPCANVTCEAGKVCKVEPTDEAENSDYAVKGVCRNLCQPPACNKHCKYGYIKDENGCESATCECNEPCANKTCDNVYICVPRRVTEEPPFEYVGECVQCSGMLCDIMCDYGVVMLTPACPLCQCFDPCQNVTCSEQEICSVKQRNSTAENPQSYTAVCERARICPTPICSNECPHGYMKTSAGCDTCDCYDPCMTTRCMTGMECEVKVDSQCLTDNCTQVAFAVCVPPKAPCIKNAVTVSDATSSLSNCDMDGYYKPLQCDVTGVCMCTSRQGQNNIQGLTLVHGIEKCYPADKIVGLLKMHADYDIIKPGDGVVFKQNISKQIGDLVGLPDTNVTITEFRSGSILIDFIISNDQQSLMDMAMSKLETYAARNQMIGVEYEGEHYHAEFETFIRMGPHVHSSTTLEPTTTVIPGLRKSGLSRAELLVIVIVVPVVGCLIIALLVTFCLCKFVKREKPLISDSVRSSMSFDTVLAEKGERPKSGYENPSYDNTKIRPVSGTYSTDTTIA